MRECARCGTTLNLHRHHVFFGRGRRKQSEKYGMVVDLCQWCHEGPDGPHHNAEYRLTLERQYQQIFEEKHGHDKFMEVFGKNYL